MGLLEQEIKELRQMLRAFDAGKINGQDLELKLKIYQQTEKRAKLMLQGFALAAKFKNKPLNRAFKANLIGDGTAIDTGTDDPENELIKCPGMDFDFIKRHQCLDYSDDNKFEECNGCETGAITKKLLLSNAIEFKPGPQEAKL